MCFFLYSLPWKTSCKIIIIFIYVFSEGKKEAKTTRILHGRVPKTENISDEILNIINMVIKICQENLCFKANTMSHLQSFKEF